MYLTFGYGNVLLRFEIEFGGVCVRATDTFYSASVGFDVDHVSNGDAFFLDGFKNRGVEAEAFGSAGGFEADDDVGYCFAVPAERVWRFFGGEFGDFAFVDFFGFTDAET